LLQFCAGALIECEVRGRLWLISYEDVARLQVLLLTCRLTALAAGVVRALLWGSGATHLAPGGNTISVRLAAG